jgi:predicted DNA binding CopG/RHH family protein
VKKTKIPAFRSEVEEARWWDANRGKLDRAFVKSVRAGSAKRMTRADLLKRVASSRAVSIRLPETDLARMRRLATKKGLPYQTYMKSLLHEALDREEKSRAK